MSLILKAKKLKKLVNHQKKSNWMKLYQNKSLLNLEIKIQIKTKRSPKLKKELKFLQNPN